MVIAFGEPWRFIAFLMNLSAAALVPGLGDEGLQHLALMIDGAPEVAHLAVDASRRPRRDATSNA